MTRLLRRLILTAAAGIFLVNIAVAQDRVMMQGFYWDVHPGGVWYDTLITRAGELGRIGFDGIWLPPLSKGAAGGFDVGYTPYDYFDLGRYDSCPGDGTQGQGGCMSTRYGTAPGLKEAVQVLQSHGLEVYADIVLNHRSGGLLEPNIYSHFYTDRNGGSLFSPDGEHTFTAFPLTHGSGRVAWPVGGGNEFFYPNDSNNPGNTFDFFSDSQLNGFHQMYVNSFGYDNALHDGFGNNLPLGDSLMLWGDWLTDKLGLDGFRFDFVKGIHPEYLKRWVDHGAMNGKFHVHELFDGDINRLTTYHSMVSGSNQPPAIFDFNMRFAYKAMSDGGLGYEIWRWQESGLMNQFGFPFDQIVTFVENHDFDRINFEGNIEAPGHSPVVNNKMLAYAHMLTHPGYATVWWRDYYHYGLGDEIDFLVRVRKDFASGSFWTLTRGETGHPFWPDDNPSDPWNHLYVAQRNGINDQTGLIVAINKHNNQPANVWVTNQNPAWVGLRLHDITGNIPGTTEVFGDSRVNIRANPGSYSIWVPVDYQLSELPPELPGDQPGYHQVDFANLQHPPEAEVAHDESAMFFARVYVHGRTNGPGQGAGVQAWIGYNDEDTDPSMWSNWVEAAYNADFGHLDEYHAELTLNPGTYYVASRFQFDAQDFVFGGFSETGGGFWEEDRFVSATLVVNEPPPPPHVISAAADPNPAPVNTQITVTGEISGDAASGQVSLDGGQTWTSDNVTIETDNGVESVQAQIGPFDQPTVLDVCLRAGNGSFGEAACVLVAVFDPTEGHVTGGGWIESPTGAYPAQPALEGRANFGFVARYQRGRSEPHGNTQFQFRAADLSFRSTAYEWLVVAGARAQFKGSGTVNNNGPYQFMLTAIDGDLLGSSADKFRIKIWEEGGIVYDNQMGESDAGNAATDLGGGSIMIHSSGNKGKSEAADDGTAITQQVDLPSEFALLPNYPNPFNPETQITFHIAEPVAVRLSVYDAMGREVTVLADQAMEAGAYTVAWDGRDSGGQEVASGIYLLRLHAGSFAQTRTVTFLK